MNHLLQRYKLIVIVCVVLNLISIAHFVKKNHDEFGVKPIDFLIFASTGQKFHKTGQLYKRVEDYHDRYHPSAAIFKFPPPFQLMFAPWFQSGKPSNFVMYTRLFMIGLYILTLALLFFYLSKLYHFKNIDKLYLATGILTIACWFMPYYECINWLLIEIPLLFLFTVSFLISRSRPYLSGGIMAFTACIKIYPVFLFFYHLLLKNIKSIIGFTAGCLIIITLSIWSFGLDEHFFYLKNILPVLINEPVISKWVNMNLEKFLFTIGLLNEVNGVFFSISRILLLTITAYIIYISRRNIKEKDFLIFSLLVTAMFFCFPNYWPQYQIFLLIPFSYLIAEYLCQNKPAKLFLLLPILVVLCIDDLLWQQVIDTVFENLKTDPMLAEDLMQEASQNGLGTTLYKYSFKAWFYYYLFECRALTPLALWILLILSLKNNYQRAASDLDTTS